MYILQKRENKKSAWKTCVYKNKKCKYSDIARARIAFRHHKNSEDSMNHPEREFRIIDGETDTEVK